MTKIMLVAGHGGNDPGAVGNGTNERDFIRNNIVDNVAKYLKQAGHTVAIYGKKQNMYDDTAYGQRVGNTKDYGLYWVKSQGYKVVVEFHLDAASASASGGHVIIPSAYPADSIDNGIQKALKDTVGVIRGVTKRSDLLHCNVAGQININYRLVELGFITNSGDMNYIKKNLQSFTKKIAEGIHGKSIGSSTSKSTPKKTTSKPKSTTKKTSSKLKVGQKAPKTLAHKSSKQFIAKADSAGITVCKKVGSKYQKTNLVYKAGTPNFHVYEVKDGWARIYSKDSNLWVWHERLIITKVL
ncbi:endolysin [Staphylococcus phage PG-2021_15]